MYYMYYITYQYFFNFAGDWTHAPPDKCGHSTTGPWKMMFINASLILTGSIFILWWREPKFKYNEFQIKFKILFHVFTFLSTVRIEQCIYYCGQNIENSTNLFTLPSTNLPGIEHAPPVIGCGHSTIEPWKLYLLTQHSCKKTSPPLLHTTTHNNTTQQLFCAHKSLDFQGPPLPMPRVMMLHPPKSLRTAP